ncbi:MAG: spondin domain-containing protein [Myxococcota bacterium]
MNTETTMRASLGFVLSLVLAVAGCGDDSSTGTGGAGGGAGTGGDAGTGGAAGTGGDGGAGGDAGAGGAPGTASFVLRIDNVSGPGPLPGPVSPGVVIAHDGDAPLFTVGEVDRGEGLAEIAEDGDPSFLAASLPNAVPFNTPDGADAPGPVFPGGAYEIAFDANVGDALSFATMLIQTNDVFIGPGEAGIALFDDDGVPLPERDVTALVSLWDVGSEANEAPGAGPTQAPRQGGANVGPEEGVVREFVASTHALPLPDALVAVDVIESDGTFSITLTNTSADAGTLLTPFSPTIYALHDDTVALFEVGQSAPPGLEELAEDGDPSVWATALDGAVPSVGTVGGAPVLPGEVLSFDVTPTAETPYLSFATMVVQTNDAFLAPPPSGVLLMDGGTLRSAEDVQTDIRRTLAVWDAGTEADQIPGVGPDQAPRQAFPNEGADDPDPTVRRHADATNRLADLSGLVEVEIAASGGGTFDVTIRTTGVEEGFPVLTPVAWAVHSAATSFFEIGAPASEGLEAVAEDGFAGTLADALLADPAVGSSGVEGAGPALPGEGYSFSVTPTAVYPYLSFATMFVPSNDAFLAFGPSGVRLVDEAGVARSDEDIMADVEATLAAWDAGTEQNQAGAGGADQAPRQAEPNTGEPEGDATVRVLPDGVWSYPDVGDVVRITLRPAP